MSILLSSRPIVSGSISHLFLKTSIRTRFLNVTPRSTTTTITQSFLGLNRNFATGIKRTLLQKENTTATSIFQVNFWNLSKRSYATHNELRHRARKERQEEFYHNVKGPLIFTIAFVAGVFIVTPLLFKYTPLSYFNSHSKNLLYSIIGVNVLVFGAWQLANRGALSNKQVTILMRYFLHTKNIPGRQHNISMILSGFSHQDFFHLLFNMLCFYSFGTTMVIALGPEKFLEVYLTGIAGSSLASTLFSAFTRAGLVSSLGASGGVSTIFAMFGMLFPKASVAFWFIPIPGGASMAVLGFTIYNLAGCVLKWSTFDFAAHLGGTFVGIVYAQYIKYLMEKRKKEKRRVRYF